MKEERILTAAFLAEHQLSGSITARFWNKIGKRGAIPERCPELGRCWTWSGGARRNGYGVLRRGEAGAGFIGARQFSFLIHGGKITPKKPCVLHYCDNPECCNPEHLWAGTMRDNCQDMLRKGRNGYTGTYQAGEANNAAKLTAAQVRAIVKRYAKGGISMRDLGCVYGVCAQQVCNIVHGNHWQSVRVGQLRSGQTLTDR